MIWIIIWLLQTLFEESWRRAADISLTQNSLFSFHSTVHSFFWGTKCSQKKCQIELWFISIAIGQRQDWRLKCGEWQKYSLVFPVGCKMWASRVTWPYWVTAWQPTSLCWTESDFESWPLVSNLTPPCGSAGCSGTTGWNSRGQRDVCGSHHRNKVMWINIKLGKEGEALDWCYFFLGLYKINSLTS